MNKERYKHIYAPRDREREALKNKEKGKRKKDLNKERYKHIFIKLFLF